MRRIPQTFGAAAAVVALVGVNVPVTGAQGIISGIDVPTVSVVTIGMPVGLPAGVSVSVPHVPNMAGISVGIAGTAASSKGHVTRKESNTVEEATITLGE